MHRHQPGNKGAGIKATLAVAWLCGPSGVLGYEVADIVGQLDAAGYVGATFSDLNNRGQLAGSSGAVDGFFIWSRQGLQRQSVRDQASYPLEYHAIADINDRGEVLGIGRRDPPRDFSVLNFIWRGENQLQWFSNAGAALALNNNGQVAGELAPYGNSPRMSFSWLASTGWQALGQLPGDRGSTLVGAGGLFLGQSVINDRGQIAGVSFGPDLAEGGRAFVWQRGVMTALPTVGVSSAAYAINNLGDVAGNGHSGGVDSAVLWRGGQPVDLGTLTGLPGSDARARAVNNLGHVVGRSLVLDGSHSAFIWRNGVMTDLNALYTLPEGYRAIEGLSINDRGQVMVLGDRPGATTDQRLFVITPDQTPRQLVVARGGDAAPFTTKGAVVPVGQVIGAVDASTGAFSVRRADGSLTGYGGGARPQLFLRDVIETTTGASVQLRFDDGTSMSLAANSLITLDEYVYDPSPPAPGTASSWLRSVFVFAGELIGRDDGKDKLQTVKPVGSLGIRGDAADHISPDLLDLAVKMNVGSPVSLSTFVTLPQAAFDLSFDHVFLTAGGTLSIRFDGLEIGLFQPTADAVGSFRHTVLHIDDAEVLALGQARLEFLFDGPAGASLLLDDVRMAGLENGSFDAIDRGWFQDGPGSLELVATISDEQLAAITAVPEPSGGLLMLVGSAGLLAWRRHRQAPACC